MLTRVQSAERAKRGSRWSPLVSAALHLSVVTVLVLVAAKSPRVVPIHNPGSAAGKHILLTYSTGAAPSVAESAVPKQALTITKQSVEQKPALVSSATESKPVAEQGSGSAGLSGLGDGNMTIAVLKLHARPQPNLSSLSPGRGGNLILNAVIDAQGSISQLTVVQSLSDSVDQQIMASVRGWSFDPATKNGQPVASEQLIVCITNVPQQVDLLDLCGNFYPSTPYLSS